MSEITLQVQGMSCGHCVKAVETAVQQIGAEASVNLEKGAVTVQYDDSKITVDQIKEAIEDQGYDVV
jgi:copper chaperone